MVEAVGYSPGREMMATGCDDPATHDALVRQDNPSRIYSLSRSHRRCAIGAVR
jgi:hypothetical protein